MAWRKLQKLVVERDETLDQLVQAAIIVFYNRDLENEKKMDKQHGELMAAMSASAHGFSSTSYFSCRKEVHFKKDCPRGINHLLDCFLNLVLCVRGTTGRLDVLGT